MQPQFLLVELGRMVMIAKEQAVLNQNHARRNKLEPGVFLEQLVGEDEQIQFWFSMDGLSIVSGKCANILTRLSVPSNSDTNR